MMHAALMRLLGVAACALLTACATQAPPPDWQADAQSALETFRQHYLAGDVKLAAHALAEARRHVSGTGDLALAARVDLIRCGISTTALDFAPCENVADASRYATDEDRAYAAFVAGDWKAIDRPHLPRQYREVVARSEPKGRLEALRAIDDPVSRLVAAGALFRQTVLPPEGVAVAVDTASAQGYRRPLLAWLRTQEQLAVAAGDAASAAQIRRRIELAGGGGEVTRP